MEQSKQHVSEETADNASPPNDLTRPLRGRVVAGVAMGLSNHFGISPLLIRAGFVITAFVGGMGIALYIAGWALIRGEGESETPAQRFFAGADSTGRWVGIALMALAALILLSNFSFVSGDVLFALLILGVGVLMYGGYIARPGGQRSGGTNGGSDDKEGVQPDVTN